SLGAAANHIDGGFLAAFQLSNDIIDDALVQQFLKSGGESHARRDVVMARGCDLEGSIRGAGIVTRSTVAAILRDRAGAGFPCFLGQSHRCPERSPPRARRWLRAVNATSGKASGW